MARHILVPMDDSEQARGALNYALTEYPDAKITIFHALNPVDLASYAGMDGGLMANYEEIQTRHQEQAEQLLADVKEQAAEHGVTVTTELQIGNPANRIVAYAEEHEIDHIVLGSHGRSGVSRILLGSVAETVTRRSPVPVTIIR